MLLPWVMLVADVRHKRRCEKMQLDDCIATNGAPMGTVVAAAKKVEPEGEFDFLLK